jgi:2-polyprenyl-3-methyl-5-hydroxy-6-metoxy-1,4-benzoquinol methylase
MEEWREIVYKNYSSNKRKTNLEKNNDCIFFQKRILKLLSHDKKISILDLGAGHGSLLYCLKQSGYENIKGVDISEEEVSIAKSRGIDVLHKDIFDYLEKVDERFDVVFVVDVLEHLDKSSLFRLLKLIQNVLTNRGVVIAQVPNAEGVFGMRIRYGDITHEQSFTSKSIVQILTSIGFGDIVIEELSPIGKGFKGIVRKALWQMLVFPFRIILLLETGSKKHFLSQNILFHARIKSEESKILKE